MAASSRFLSRLLLIAGPPAIVACTPDTSKKTPPPRSHLAPITIPKPPLEPTLPLSSYPLLAPSSSASAFRATSAEGPAFTICGPDYRAWEEEMSGKPMVWAECYVRSVPTTACLAADAPTLRQALTSPLRSRIQCVYDGPFEQAAPVTGEPWCCYNVGAKGDGRPLLIEGKRRASALVRREDW